MENRIIYGSDDIPSDVINDVIECIVSMDSDYNDDGDMMVQYVIGNNNVFVVYNIEDSYVYVIDVGNELCDNWHIVKHTMIDYTV